MEKLSLYNIATHYIEIIERIEQVAEVEILTDLEEERVKWHNRLIQALKKRGIPFQDREQVTVLAYRIIRNRERFNCE